jgi:hypothetical protein
METEVERISIDEAESRRWKDILRLTNRPSKFAPEYFEPGDEVSFYESTRFNALFRRLITCNRRKYWFWELVALAVKF